MVPVVLDEADRKGWQGGEKRWRRGLRWFLVCFWCAGICESEILHLNVGYWNLLTWWSTHGGWDVQNIVMLFSYISQGLTFSHSTRHGNCESPNGNWLWILEQVSVNSKQWKVLLRNSSTRTHTQNKCLHYLCITFSTSAWPCRKFWK